MQAESLQDILTVGLSPVHVPMPVKLSEYANENFVLVKADTKLGEWENLPYQVAILNWMGNDDIEVLTIRKSARTGATKLLCINWAYKTEHLHRDTLLFQPTADDAKDFKDEELDGLVLHMQSLRGICKTDPEKRSSNNTVSKLSFVGATTHILGGKTPRNFRRMTKDEVSYDELSAFDPDIGGEGSVTTLGDTRTETSSFGKSIRNSTPKIKGSCQVSASLAEADVIMYRWLPCPHCGKFQVLKWRDEHKNYRFHLETNEYICDNGCMISYDRYAEMDSNGQWRSIDESIVYDEELDMFFIGGEPMETPRHVGVDKLWSAYSYFLGWEKLNNIFKEATSEHKKTGDYTKLKSFINTKLGEEWEDVGERVDDKVFVEERLERAEKDISNKILYITLGADVQGGKRARVEYEVVGWGIGEESWSLDYQVINGELENQDVQDHLDAAILRTFTRQDGVELPITCAAIDAGWNTEVTYSYTTPRQRRKVYSVMGRSEYGKPIITGYSMQGPKKKSKLYPVGTDTAKEILYTRLNKITKPGPGYCHFPDHYPERYFLGLVSEEKKKKRNKNTGRTSFIWVKFYERNEPLDCRVYNMAALKIHLPNFDILERRYLRESDRIKNNIPYENGKKRRRVRSRGAA